MEIRRATENDVELLIRLRMDYLAADYGELGEDVAASIHNHIREYFPRVLSSDRFRAYIAEEDGNTAAGAFLVIDEWPANPSFPTGKIGTVLNVLTYPAYRRRGLASRVLRALIDEAKILGASKLELSATDEGKLVYEKLGFRPADRYTEMSLTLGASAQCG